jgi:hypothetical protein
MASDFAVSIFETIGTSHRFRHRLTCERACSISCKGSDNTAAVNHWRRCGRGEHDSAVINMPSWWTLVGPTTRQWLAANPHSHVPEVLADQVEAAGGVLFDATWVSRSGQSVPVRFLNPLDQTWIEAHGPGEWP